MTAGSYVKDGWKTSWKFFFHHFGYIFVFWVYGLASFLGRLLVLPAPFFQHSQYNYSRMLKHSGEMYLSKSFDEDGSSYGSLLAFDALWFLFTAMGIAFLMGLGYLLYYVIISIDLYYYPEGTIDMAAFNDFKANALYCLIPFGVLAFVFLIFALMVLQSASHVASINRNLKLGDIAFQAFYNLKQNGGRLFGIDILYFLEFLTVAIVVGLPIFLVFYFCQLNNSEDPYLPLYILWIMIAAEAPILLLLLPPMAVGFQVSVSEFFEQEATADPVVLVMEKKDDSEVTKYEKLSPAENKGEPKKFFMHHLSRKEKKKQKEEKKNEGEL